MRRTVLTVLLAGVFCASTASARQHEEEQASPYAGLEARGIASLSEDDVTELLAGGGWGFALPAELNGLPGPRHVLDMADELALTADQRARTQAIFDSMQSGAADLGRVFVERERALDGWFEHVAAGRASADADSLEALVDAAGEARSRLRAVHLDAHLRMMDVLSSGQIETYGRLRGYVSGDPCEDVPEGHDEAMWRMHNDCEG